jgi:outer membrane protein OmpA-like peptidoglycan-associated protein
MMRQLGAISMAGCLLYAGGAMAEGPAAPASASSADYADALMNLDCATCEPPVEHLRGFSLTTPGATKPAAHATAAPAPRAAGARVAAAQPRHVSAADLQLTFRLGSADLTPEGEANARNFAAALNDPRLNNAAFQIVGHTDATGPRDLNQRLSQARAESVKGFLVRQGVAATRLEAKGVGSDDLAVPEDPAAAANRRVEVKRIG